MPEHKLKVLVINPSIDGLAKCIKIINSQNKKAGPFDFALLLGDVFTEDQSKELEKLKPDIPVYFTQGNKNHVETKEVDMNFIYLGDFGITKLSNGLKIGYISGDTKKYNGEEIQNKFKGQEVDILLTYHWPDSIAKEEKLLLSADCRLDYLLESTKPQYWFACGVAKGRYFERDPYSIDNRVTRFISLAEMGTDRFWYAFQIALNPEPIIESVGKRPVLDKASSSLPKRPLPESSEKSIAKRQNGTSVKPLEISPDSCFLCLSNPIFELHMVVSVAKTCYLSVTKGPLTLKNELGFSGHGMIVPIEHYPTLRTLAHSKNADAKVQEDDVYKEVTEIQQSLVKMFRSLGNTSVIFWEISRQRSVHAHLQFVPVPDSLVGNFQNALDGQIEFTKKPDSDPIEYTKFAENDDQTALFNTINSEDYILFTICEKAAVTMYLIKLGNECNKFFDVQFPRKVLAVLLNLKNRIHWTKCKETRDEESAEKAAFKLAYGGFDIMKKK